MRLLFVLAVVSIAALAAAQAPRSAIRFINPEALSTPTGYTHVVEAPRGRTIYVAGQVALDKTGAVVGRGDFRAQTKQVFENLKAALAAAGAGFKDVVKTNTYVTDVSQLPALREVRAGYLGANPPASTLVQVSRLAREEFLIEVEAIAVIPE
jgi:reactive intermediate/imine deaminase